MLFGVMLSLCLPLSGTPFCDFLSRFVVLHFMLLQCVLFIVSSFTAYCGITFCSITACITIIWRLKPRGVVSVTIFCHAGDVDYLFLALHFLAIHIQCFGLCYRLNVRHFPVMETLVVLSFFASFFFAQFDSCICFLLCSHQLVSLHCSASRTSGWEIAYSLTSGDFGASNVVMLSVCDGQTCWD